MCIICDLPACDVDKDEYPWHALLTKFLSTRRVADLAAKLADAETETTVHVAMQPFDVALFVSIYALCYQIERAKITGDTKDFDHVIRSLEHLSPCVVVDAERISKLLGKVYHEYSA